MPFIRDDFFQDGHRSLVLCYKGKDGSVFFSVGGLAFCGQRLILKVLFLFCFVAFFLAENLLDNLFFGGFSESF